MVLGVGVDIMKITQLKAEFLVWQDPFVQKTYSKKEYEQAMERDAPLYYFATRFAGKEAVFKSLNWKDSSIQLRDIEILSNEYGQPFVMLHGKVKEHARAVGIVEVLISLSYDTEHAIAYAIAQNEISK